MARLALKAGGGRLSGGKFDASVFAGDADPALALEAAAFFPLEHANSARTKIRKKSLQVLMSSFWRRVLDAGWDERTMRRRYLEHTKRPSGRQKRTCC